jgi:hypothetical protein
MTRIHATFDGHVLTPEEPGVLEPNKRYSLIVEDQPGWERERGTRVRPDSSCRVGREYSISCPTQTTFSPIAALRFFSTSAYEIGPADFCWLKPREQTDRIMETTKRGITGER